MNTTRVAVIAGDGVGPDLITQVAKVATALNKRCDCHIELTNFPYSADYYLKSKISIPEEFIDQISLNYNAILLGPLGDPRIPDMIHAKEIIFKLRNRLNLKMNIHPVKLYRSWLSSIKDAEMKTIDLFIIRDNVEDATSMHEHSFNQDKDTEVLMRTNVVIRKNADDFIKSALHYASLKNRNSICFCDRQLILPESHLFWKSIITEHSAEFPGLQISYMMSNTVIREIIENPDEFEVILTTGYTGDILSSLAAVITGGFGLYYTIETNPDLITVYRIRQSASNKYAGHNTANPLGAILALKNILEDQDLSSEAELLGKAIENNFENHLVTIDLGGIIGTEEVGDYICDFILKKSGISG